MKPNAAVRVSLLVLASVAALTAQVAREENVVPLKNWAAPLYWQPNQAEREAATHALPQKAAPQLVFSANAVSTNALTFVAITPCRLVDTRGAAAGFNGIDPFAGPSIPPGGTLTIPVQSATEASTNTTPAPCGVIPAIAQAYSFNLTLVPHAGGGVGYISLWPSSSPQPVVSTLNDLQGLVVANAAIVPAGTPSGGVSVYNSGPGTTDVIIDMNGFYAAPTDLNGNTAIGLGTLASNTSGFNNTATGNSALTSNTTGCCNTANGNAALSANTTGSSNTATGGLAMQANTTGSNNSAFGHVALNANTTGNNNTALGANVLQSNTTGNNNTASGQNAMNANTTGCCNTASGQSALSSNTTGNANTAIGGSALQDNTTGGSNTAVGQAALLNNTTGSNNAAVGQAALLNNTTGTNNVAVGPNALNANTTASGNSALGAGALGANTGTQNAAVGTGALGANVGGSENVAIGWGALGADTGGNNNIAIGNFAAHNLTGNMNNIHIGSQGNSADNNTVRIGTQGTQTSFFAAGVSGITTGNADAVTVVIDSNGQLGTVISSQRFKEDIQDMGEASSGLLRLRPVTFRYKKPYADGTKPLDYGLIAEEVAKVYPGLVVKTPDGQIETVQYQKLTPMLLNEIQKQNAQLQLQKEENRKLEERLAALEARLSGQTATVARPVNSQ